MKNKGHLALIKRLQTNNTGYTTKELSSFLNCSERTVRNHIKEINNFNTYIIAEKDRYKIAPGTNIKELEEEFKNSSVQDTILFIISKLLTNADGLKIDNLLDELYISEKTLEKYVSEMNRYIGDLDLTVGKKSGYLILKGEEKAKRELFKRNLRLNDYSVIENGLSVYCDYASIDYERFKSILKESLDKYGIYVNDYSFLNILTHLVVKVIRIKTGSDFNEFDISSITPQSNERDCAEDITRKLNKDFNININPTEINRLANLIAFKTVAKETAYYVANKTISTEYHNFVIGVLQKIKSRFGISLNDDEFTYFLSLHISNLVKRAQSGIYNENPLFEQVLNSDSFIYELAVFMTSELENSFGISIPDSEIGFLAFHLGSVIVKKNLFAEEINIAVFTYDFYGFSELLKNELLSLKSPSLHFYFFDKDAIVPNYNYDILITTMFGKEKGISYQSKVIVNPMYTRKDILAIQAKISEIEEEKNRHKATIYIDQFFNYNFFEKNVYLKNEEEYIRYISNKLINNHIVDKEYLENALERERLTPTSFENGIAIPHSIKGQAMANHAYVILNDKPIRWGNYDIHAVIMIALKEDGYIGFRYIMDALMENVSNREDVLKLAGCKDFPSFLNFIKGKNNS